MRQSETFAIDLFEDSITSAAKKGVADLVAKALRIVTVTGFAKNFGAVRMCNERIEVNLAVGPHLGVRADRNLTTAAEFVKQRALTSRGGAGSRVVKESQ